MDVKKYPLVACFSSCFFHCPCIFLIVSREIFRSSDFLLFLLSFFFCESFMCVPSRFAGSMLISCRPSNSAFRQRYTLQAQQDHLTNRHHADLCHYVFISLTRHLFPHLGSTLLSQARQDQFTTKHHADLHVFFHRGTTPLHPAV